MQSDINKELKASIASASGKTYSKSEIDSKDTATLTSAKSYADTKKTEAVSAAATDATTKANNALASAKSYADSKVSALGSVYTTKGSCTAAQLKALTSAKAGDVWNITDAVTIDGKAYPAGVNVVCVTAFSTAIDPATTKNWDALQGVQDLTPYAKKSEIEDTAVANVKFAQEEFAQDNGVSFKKTITFVNGREATTESDLGILPATSSKAGVMSAADKVKLDAVDGRIQGVKVYNSNTEGFIIQNAQYNSLKAIIGTDTKIGSNSKIGDSVNIGGNINIDNGVDLHDNIYISDGFESYEGVMLGTNAIGTNLQGVHQGFGTKIAIGTGVQIAQGVGIAVDDSCLLVFGREIQGVYQTKTAATTDALSALATRVSALEDLLKLA